MTQKPGFITVSAVPKYFDLSGRDIYRRSIYPSSTNWTSYEWPAICESPTGGLERVDDALDRCFADRSDGIVTLTGGSGTGKTFHALLYGFKASQKPKRSLTSFFKSSLQVQALYTASGYIDSAAITQLFSRKRDLTSPFLWIIDEINQFDPAFPYLAETAVAEFEGAGLSAEGHRLLCVGTAVPECLEPYGVVRARVTAESIQAAVSAVPTTYPPTAETRRLLENLGTVGLKTILAVASVRPQQQQTEIEFLDGGAKTQLSRLSAEACRLVEDLSLAHLAGIPANVPIELAAVLQELKLQDLTEDAGEGAVRLKDESFAQAILRQRAIPTDLPESIYVPLFEVIRRRENVSFVAPAILNLRSRKAADVFRILSVSSPATHANFLTLWAGVLKDKLLPLVASLDLTSFTAVLNSLASVLDTRTLGKERLDQHGARLKLALRDLDLPTWLAVRRLTRLLGDDSFDPELNAFLQSPELESKIRAAPAGIAVSFVDSAGTYLPSERPRLQRALLPDSPADIALMLRGLSAAEFWRFMSKKARLLGPNTLDASLRSLPRRFLADAVYQRPTPARVVLTRSREGKTVRRVFDDALKKTKWTAESVAHLGSIEGLVDLVSVLRRFNAPALESPVIIRSISDLMRTEGQSSAVRAITREARGLPVSHRLHKTCLHEAKRASGSLDLATRLLMLKLLAPTSARKLALKALKGYETGVPSEDLRTFFWIVWNANAILTSAKERDALVKSLRISSTQIGLSNDSPLIDLAVAGLLAVITRQPVKLRTLVVPQPDTMIEGFTGTMATCALVGLSHLPATLARQEWLLRIGVRLLAPELKSVRVSDRTLASDRRLLSALLRDALSRIAREGVSESLLEAWALKLENEEADRYWLARPSTRLQLLITCANSRVAARTLSRWGAVLLQQLQANRPSEDLIGLLWVTHCLSYQGSTEKLIARQLIAAAESCGLRSPSVRSAIETLATVHYLPAAEQLEEHSTELQFDRDAITDVLSAAWEGRQIDRSTISRLIEALPLSQLARLRLILDRAVRERNYPRKKGPFMEAPADETDRLEQLAFERGTPADWAQLGRAHRKAGRYDAAVSALRKSLEILPNQLKVWRELAIAFDQLGKGQEKNWASRQGRTEEASATADEENAARAKAHLRKSPHVEFQWIKLAKSLNRLGRMDEAIRFGFEQATDHDGVLDGIYRLCEEYGNDEPARVAPLLEKLIDWRPMNARYWTFLASLRRKAAERDGSHEFEPAVLAGLRATELAPSDARAWYVLGKAYAEAGHTSRADECLRRATTLGHTRAVDAISTMKQQPPNPRNTLQ